MWNSKKESLCVVCDVGTASVSAALVLFSQTPKDSKPRILFSTFVPISVMPEPDMNHLESLVSGYVKTAFDTLVHEGLVSLQAKNIKVGSIQKAFISLATPWFVSKTATRTIADKTPFVFDEKLISATLEEEEKAFEAKKVELVGPDAGKDMRMIERTVVSVSLNGYPTANPFGKMANVADLSLYMSLAPEKLLQDIRTVAKDALHNTKVTFHTFPLVSFGALAELFPQTKEYFFFDVAGEYTHVFFSKDGSMENSVSFPLGRNALLRALMATGVNETLARSTLAVWKEGDVGGTLEPRVANVISNYRNDWTTECKKVLDASSVGARASVCFLIADVEVEGVFVSFLKACVNAISAPRIVALAGADMKNTVNIEKHGDRDPFLALQAVFANIHADPFS